MRSAAPISRKHALQSFLHYSMCLYFGARTSTRKDTEKTPPRGPPWGLLPSVNLGAHPRSDGPHFFLKFPTPEREGCQHWPQKMPYLKCRRHRGGEQHGQHCEELKKAKQERVRHGSRQAPVPPAPAEQFAAQAGSTGIASQASFLIGMTRARGRGAVATPGPRFQC